MDVVISPDAFERFRENIAAEAIHDSSERRFVARDLTSAERNRRDEVLSWIKQDRRHAQPKKIAWLSGPEKTLVAHSIAEHCEKDNILAATFFNPPSGLMTGQLATQCFVATIAYQIARLDGFELLSGKVMDAIQQDPTIFNPERLTDQLERLVLEPLRQITQGDNPSTLPMVVVIDGLDPPPLPNVGTTVEHDTIYSILLRAASDDAFPFRILVTSQSDTAMQEFVSCHAEAFQEISYTQQSVLRRWFESLLANRPPDATVEAF